ncbi:ankyrin repeat domain-containing protein [Rugosimonospora acidiphila]|uniref:Ankyrin repeat domain-containing protein n=1 Tax=Rugosimonospora acidiphila TaxID=556531 RepID=A0ABP9RQL6_9ACTN
MPARSLSDHPNLEHLRNQARALQRAVRRADPDALRRVVDRGVDLPADPTSFALHGAQLVLAREYGFASWPRLRRYLDVVAEYRWDVSTVTEPAGGEVADSAAAGDEAAGDEAVGSVGADVADEFCRLACLTYSDDGPPRWQRAAELLARHPELIRDSVWAAAAAVNVDALRRQVDADPSLVRRRGGPYRWRPLYYLVYSRLEPAGGRDGVLEAVRLLLRHGADPDEGYLWNGLPTPFTLLTGAFGEGEQGPVRQPRHPRSVQIARLLLEAGANPNDGQTLYNRMFREDDDHLRLLFEFGLGTGDGGVWKRRLGDALDSPADMLRGQLSWAIDHGFTERVRLLARHGVDLVTPFDDRRTPVERARLSANRDIVELLLAHGAPAPAPDPVDDLIGAAMAADRAAVRALVAAHPGVAEGARSRRPGLIVWAAAGGRREAVRLLAELGFDVSALGRGDTPVEQPWSTALHHAAADGDLELASTLLALGADPNVTDLRFGTTPLGWARHFERSDLVALLEPVTAGGDPAVSTP